MKYLVAAAVTAIIVLAPLGSYIYLRKGFKYRLQAIEELKPKNINPDHRATLDSLWSGSGKVNLIYFASEDSLRELEIYNKIEERIVDRTRFDLSRISYDYSHKTEANMEYPFYLLDTSGAVRNYYHTEEHTSANILKHLSVLIPMPKRKEIKLKRDVK